MPERVLARLLLPSGFLACSLLARQFLLRRLLAGGFALGSFAAGGFLAACFELRQACLFLAGRFLACGFACDGFLTRGFALSGFAACSFLLFRFALCQACLFQPCGFLPCRFLPCGFLGEGFLPRRFTPGGFLPFRLALRQPGAFFALGFAARRLHALGILAGLFGKACLFLRLLLFFGCAALCVLVRQFLALGFLAFGLPPRGLGLRCLLGARLLLQHGFALAGFVLDECDAFRFPLGSLARGGLLGLGGVLAALFFFCGLGLRVSDAR